MRNDFLVPFELSEGLRRESCRAVNPISVHPFSGTPMDPDCQRKCVFKCASSWLAFKRGARALQLGFPAWDKGFDPKDDDGHAGEPTPLFIELRNVSNGPEMLPEPLNPPNLTDTRVGIREEDSCSETQPMGVEVRLGRGSW